MSKQLQFWDQESESEPVYGEISNAADVDVQFEISLPPALPANSVTTVENLYGTTLFGDPIQPSLGALATRFLIPPFTVLDGRSGAWQDRKRAWLNLGINSGAGRSDRLLGFSNLLKDKFRRKESKDASVFDPVLCELTYRWFCPTGGTILDPFAGGSVRGLVAGVLGYRYIGLDLRTEQVQANIVQSEQIKPQVMPTWLCGDSRRISEYWNEPVDFVFTCPPYGDLEQYSSDPADLSNMSPRDFLSAYRLVLAQTCQLLKEHRFAAIVVGDYRGPDGFYRGFVADTIRCFVSNGLGYYNEGIYVTPLGTLPIRSSRHFDRGRKLGKTHQNLLVFVKGDPRKASDTVVGQTGLSL